MYPSTWQSSLLSEFNQATADGMRAARMSAVNVLGQNDDAPMDRELRPLLVCDWSGVGGVTERIVERAQCANV